jgi:hypothetical protein
MIYLNDFNEKYNLSFGKKSNLVEIIFERLRIN